MADVNSFQSALANVSQQQTEDDISTSSTNKHLTVAQMRGVVPLFNHYFKVYDDFGNRKNLNKESSVVYDIKYRERTLCFYIPRIGFFHRHSEEGSCLFYLIN